jgi:ribosomal-protein-alanine N-acetyltransferase
MISRQPIYASRLILRPFCLEDKEDLFGYLSNPQVYRFESGEPIDRKKAQSLAEELTASADFWAVELRESQQVIGQIYFKHIEPLHLMTWKSGYILNPDYHRQGYMSEGVIALVQYGFATTGIRRLVAKCNPENTASWRLLEKSVFDERVY